MKKESPSLRGAYYLYPVVLENALRFIEAGEVLWEKGYYSQAFIMGSFAVEEIGKATQLQTIAAVGGKNVSISDHNMKHDAYTIQSVIEYLMSKYQDGIQRVRQNIIQKRNISTENTREEILQMLMDSIQEFIQEHPQIQNEVQTLIDAFKNDDTRDRYEWMDIRFQLLYTDTGDTGDMTAKWQQIRTKSKLAQLLESGVVLKGLRTKVDTLKAAALASNGVSFEEFQEFFVSPIIKKATSVEKKGEGSTPPTPS